jgi:ribonuclease-3 family protein
MEESLTQNLTESIKNVLGLKEISPAQLSPLVLAYIGDSIFDLVIKTYLLDTKGNMQVNKLNRFASNIVKAQSQSEMIRIIEPLLSPAEEAVYKRGRNAKSYTSAKNASISDYRRATGFEALMGYLYLEGEYERMIQLIKAGLDKEK